MTGRLLVGLRWWNNMKEDGTSEWVFESHQVRVSQGKAWPPARAVHALTGCHSRNGVVDALQGTRDIHPLDYRIFWGALILSPALWYVPPRGCGRLRPLVAAPHRPVASPRRRVLFGVFAALRNLQWLVIVAVAVALNGANVVGYVKCSNGTLPHKWAVVAVVGRTLTGLVMFALVRDARRGQEQAEECGNTRSTIRTDSQHVVVRWWWWWWRCQRRQRRRRGELCVDLAGQQCSCQRVSSCAAK